MSQLEERKCRFCGKLFKPKTSLQMCCCTEHGHKWRNQRRRTKAKTSKDPVEQKECAVCGQLFTSYRPNQVCCSPDCAKQRNRERFNAYQRAVYQEQRQEEGPRQTAFGLDTDPYKTGRLRSDALFCPVI